MGTCIRMRLPDVIGISVVFKGLVLHPASGVKCIRKNVKPELITQHNQYVYLKNCLAALKQRFAVKFDILLMYE